MLAAHFRALAFCVGLCGDCNTGDGDLLLDDRIDAAGKAKLDRAAHLPAVEGCLDKSGHHRAEGADIEEFTAHEIADFFIQIGIVFFAQLLFLHAEGGKGLPVTFIEGHVVLDINPVAGPVLTGGFHIIADFALEADVRDDTMVGFRIDTRHIARIRVSIWVPVFHVEKNDEIVPVFDRL